MTFGVGGLMLLMIFIVGHLAWEAKVGKPPALLGDSQMI